MEIQTLRRKLSRAWKKENQIKRLSNADIYKNHRQQALNKMQFELFFFKIILRDFSK